MRVSLVVAAAVAAMAASIPVAMAATTAETPCVRHDLPVPAGATNAVVRWSDPTGRYQLGSWQEASGGSRVLVWRDGVPLDRGPLPEDNSADLISTRGEIVGSSAVIGDQYLWRLRNGERTRLPAPSGAFDVLATDINSGGEITGIFSEEFLGSSRAIVWRADNSYRVLPIPPGFASARADAIDDDGTVLGQVGDEAQTRVIVWFRDGTWKLLSPADSWATGSNIRRGVVAGQLAGTPVTWTVSSGEVAQLGAEGHLLFVNARRSVVGFVDQRDVLIKRSGVVRPIPASSDAGINMVGLDDLDNVYGWDWGTETYAVRWSCR
jgi:hypothetical protein